MEKKNFFEKKIGIAEARTSAPFEQSARAIITYYRNNCDNK